MSINNHPEAGNNCQSQRKIFKNDSFFISQPILDVSISWGSWTQLNSVKFRRFKNGAGEGNRTLLGSLEGYCITTMLRPLDNARLSLKKLLMIFLPKSSFFFINFIKNNFYSFFTWLSVHSIAFSCINRYDGSDLFISNFLQGCSSIG